MDRSKVMDFFDAAVVEVPLHVVGCGAIGSHVCEELARIGFTSIHIYDFDTVSPHNITNQMFTHFDIGAAKVEACAAAMRAINPDIIIHEHAEGLQHPYICNGIIILCVDDIGLRKAITNANRYNPYCKAIADFRMRMTDAQHYFASKDVPFEMEQLLNSMDFTHEEAKESTPVSACGVELSVVYTVKAITAFGCANLVKFLMNSEDYKTMVLVNMNSFIVDAFRAVPLSR